MTNAAFTETVEYQRSAASPERSAFVSANAGSGKTRVLTNRVARLLLAGAAPSKILCITYTKAAAAEMATRLFDLLGDWALADDEALRDALAELEGADSAERSQEELSKARRLFARALETPGGLKIQTIHSFCESVLRRFPLEAGAPPGFAIIEEAEAAALRRSAIDAAARDAAKGGVLSSAFAVLANRRHGDALRDYLMAALSDPQSNFRTDFQGLKADAIKVSLAAELKISPEETESSIQSQTLAAIDASEIASLAEALLLGGKMAKGRSEKLARYPLCSSTEERFSLLASAFLTGAGARLARGVCDKPVRDAHPELAERAETIAEAMALAVQKIRAVRVFEETMAVAKIVAFCEERYAMGKSVRAALDFDDLIDLTHRLFLDGERVAWVMYKLDQGIDHILLDEAQDTSPKAWGVIEGVLRDFIAGAGAKDEQRTFFAVGDQKQSIYSFQGADSALFNAKQIDLGQRLAGVTAFENVPLNLSFRTTGPILSFVDALFADKSILDGVSDADALKHGLFREGQGGCVELWPLAPAPEKQDIAPWDAPLDVVTTESAIAKLTAQVASTIRGWLDTDEILESKARPVRAGDVMILVQARSALFHEMIKALSIAGVPVAGADQIKLLDDQAVLDLLSCTRAALFPEDDLSLAETLKTPLFRFSEDDLFDLAYGRSGSLWNALHDRHSEREAWRRAHEWLKTSQQIGIREGAVAFFHHLLETGSPTGRQKFFERLGEPAREPLEEFLQQAMDYEAAHPRSLRGFLSWFLDNASVISRNPDSVDDAVQVMTVHKSKGLEAPIVFMLDAHRRHTPASRFLTIATDRNDLPAASPGAGEAPEVIDVAKAHKKRLQGEEYRRLLYVAATRAEDRLYICGYEQGNKRDPTNVKAPDKTWHALAQDAFDGLADNNLTGNSAHELFSPYTLWEEPVQRLMTRQTVSVQEKQEEAKRPAAPLPTALMKAARTEQATARLSPSRLADLYEARSEYQPDGQPGHLSDCRDEVISPANSADVFLRGRALHRALELLPDLKEAKRSEAADRLLARLAPDVTDDERRIWREEVFRVLGDPVFAPVFGPGSRAEVAVGGAVDCGGRRKSLYGQIDRLLVRDDEILIVDYKTNRPHPSRASEIATAYLAQMGAYRALLRSIYHDRPVKTALLWTFEARLMPLPDELIDQAFQRTLA